MRSWRRSGEPAVGDRRAGSLIGCANCVQTGSVIGAFPLFSWVFVLGSSSLRSCRLWVRFPPGVFVFGSLRKSRTVSKCLKYKGMRPLVGCVPLCRFRPGLSPGIPLHPQVWCNPGCNQECNQSREERLGGRLQIRSGHPRKWPGRHR